MKVELRIGQKRIRKRIRTDGPVGDYKTLQDFFVKESTKAVANAMLPFTMRQIKALAKAMEAAGNKELMRIFPIISNSLMGLESPRTRSKDAGVDITPVQLSQGIELRPTTSFGLRVKQDPFGKPSGSIHWSALSPRTVKRKGNSKFFVDTGALRNYFQAHGPDIISRMGGVQVTVEADKSQISRDEFRSTRILLSYLHIRVLPNVGPGALPFKATGDWKSFNPNAGLEYRFMGPSIGRKLRGYTGKNGGFGGFHRPLMQPVLGFWLGYRLPNAFAGAISRIVRGRNLGSSLGGDFSQGA